jgi:hypothetical protein
MPHCTQRLKKAPPEGRFGGRFSPASSIRQKHVRWSTTPVSAMAHSPHMLRVMGAHPEWWTPGAPLPRVSSLERLSLHAALGDRVCKHQGCLTVPSRPCGRCHSRGYCTAHSFTCEYPRVHSCTREAGCPDCPPEYQSKRVCVLLRSLLCVAPGCMNDPFGFDFHTCYDHWECRVCGAHGGSPMVCRKSEYFFLHVVCRRCWIPFNCRTSGECVECHEHACKSCHRRLPSGGEATMCANGTCGNVVCGTKRCKYCLWCRANTCKSCSCVTKQRCTRCKALVCPACVSLDGTCNVCR